MFVALSESSVDTSVSRFFLPLVSVIVPAYNAAAFIRETLYSVLNQTYPNIEVLVIDDGSIDCTVEIIQHIAQQDSRIVLIQQSNAGVAVARNRGIAQAKGEFIAPIDADDLWHPQNLEKQVECMNRAGGQVGVVYSWSVDINEHNAFIGGIHAATIEGDVYRTLLCHNFLGNASATLIRRACFEQIGGYDAQLKAQNAQGCEDWDLYLRIAEQYAFAVVPSFLVGYRKMQNSMSQDYAKMARSHCLMLKAAKQRCPEIPETLLKLSSSSFYLYLAHQCGQQKDSTPCGNRASHQTLAWLLKALESDFTPLLRPGFYILFIRSGLRILLSQILTNQLFSNYVSQILHNFFPNFGQRAHSQIAHSLQEPKWETSIQPLPSTSKVRLKLLVGKLLHVLLEMGTLRQGNLAKEDVLSTSKQPV